MIVSATLHTFFIILRYAVLAFPLEDFDASRLDFSTIRGEVELLLAKITLALLSRTS